MHLLPYYRGVRGSCSSKIRRRATYRKRVTLSGNLPHWYTHHCVPAQQMADGNDSDSRKSQDERRRSRNYGEGKSNEENMGAESAHRDNEHRRGRESEFQGWKEQSQFRDIPMPQAPGPPPPSHGWGQHRGNERGYRSSWGTGLRQSQRKKRKREEQPAKSDNQMEKMVGNIVEKQVKFPTESISLAAQSSQVAGQSLIQSTFEGFAKQTHVSFTSGQTQRVNHCATGSITMLHIKTQSWPLA